MFESTVANNIHTACITCYNRASLVDKIISIIPAWYLPWFIDVTIYKAGHGTRAMFKFVNYDFYIGMTVEISSAWNEGKQGLENLIFTKESRENNV